MAFSLGTGFSPPALPPIFPAGAPPPPPPSPPTPSIPAEEARFIKRVSITSATLSTYFVPTVAPSPPPYGEAYQRRLQSAASELGVTTDSATRAELTTQLTALGSETTQWAACTEDLIALGAPLPCRTGGAPQRCIDGARACGTADENTRAPFLELDFHDLEVPFNGRAYLFEVEFRIPADEEYGALLFHPPSTYGGDVQANRGWKLTVFDHYRIPLSKQCLDWNLGSSATEHTEGLTRVIHACLPATATDADYEELAEARFLKMELIGEFRQIWLDNVNVNFRAIVEPTTAADGTIVYRVADAPPPPPPQISPSPSPPHPADPPSPPPARAFTWYSQLAPRQWEDRIITEEPCGLMKEECAALADANDASGFVLSASGCCYPVDGPILVSEAVAFQWSGAGFGVF